MTSFIRKNAWDANNGGQFTHPDGSFTDLYWYAKGVQVMQARPVSDPTSWWFYAAIHGEFLRKRHLIPPPKKKKPDYRYLNWVNIPYIPTSANLNVLPVEKISNLFWDQCQHGTWYFAPWHRGYLVALENILRDIISGPELQGPIDWALPYWNYLSQNKQYSENFIPPAFGSEILPDGSSNPLYVLQRYGFEVTVGPGTSSEVANDECQWDTIYAHKGDPNENPEQIPNQIGNIYGDHYGGLKTGFNHSHGAAGDLEMNPHNFVHGMIGGYSKSTGQYGLMGVPATAALDPIFFLHHGNIDRMWAAWNETGKNKNPTNPEWRSGPVSTADRKFVMPLDSIGAPWFYTPDDVKDTHKIKYDSDLYAYSYDDLSLTSFSNTRPTHLPENLTQRLKKLGLEDFEKLIEMPNKSNMELVGSSKEGLKLLGLKLQTIVHLEKRAWKSVTKSIENASSSKLPDDIYVFLEGVKGGEDGNFLSFFVNQKFVRSVSLFGLLAASLENRAHGGGGHTYKFNITQFVDDLHLGGDSDIDSLNIEIKAKHSISGEDGISIERIAIYRVSH